MIIRPITQNDFDDVFDIYMDEVNNPFLHHEIMDKDSFKPVMEELLSRDKFLGLEQDGKIIGMCGCTFGDARTGHVAQLGALALHSDYHGTGLAHQFLTDIVDTLVSEGFKRVDLWVEDDNPKAQKFYKKLGFEEEARIKKYYKRANSDDYVDEIVMAKLF